MGDDTSIRVSEELADELFDRKRRGETYEDVIWRLISLEDSGAPASNSDAAERREEPPEGDASDTTRDPRREMLRGRLSGSGDLLERRVDAVVAMYERLQELEEADKDELLHAVDADAVRYEHADSVWSNMVKGKDTLGALPGVEKPPQGRSEWRYVGETDE